MYFFLPESALTGELKITRLSTINGSAAGEEDLFMFVEKVGKSKTTPVYFQDSSFHSAFLLLFLQKISKFVFTRSMITATPCGRIGRVSAKQMSILNMQLR